MKHLTLILFTFLLFACEDEHFSDVPDVTVSSAFDPEEHPDLFSLGTGQSIAFDENFGGYAGIILYKISDEKYHAFDLCCPIHFADKEQLILDGAIATCPTDSVHYNLLDRTSVGMGDKAQGSILKNYQCSVRNTIVYVNN